MDLSYEKISLILIGVLTHIAEHYAYYHLALWLLLFAAIPWQIPKINYLLTLETCQGMGKCKKAT